MRACLRVWCVCACVCYLSWHSSTNLSSIQIFHSDGKRPDSNSIVPWKCPFPFVDVHFYNKICHVLKGQMPGLDQMCGPVMIFTCQIPDFAPGGGGGGGGCPRNNDRRITPSYMYMYSTINCGNCLLNPSTRPPHPDQPLHCRLIFFLPLVHMHTHNAHNTHTHNAHTHTTHITHTTHTHIHTHATHITHTHIHTNHVHNPIWEATCIYKIIMRAH